MAPDRPATPPPARTETHDQLYLALTGARERLCGAQMRVTRREDVEALGRAVAAIDSVGHALPQWSRHHRDDLLPELTR